MRRRAEGEQVEDERLVVALPVKGQEASLGTPAVADRLAAGEHPGPVDALVEHAGDGADLGLGTAGAIEILRRRERAGDEDRGVDARQLAVPGASAARHVEEVIVEAAMAGRVGRFALLAAGEEAQHRQGSLGGLVALDEAAFGADHVARQRHAHCGDARWPVGGGLVENEPVLAVDLVEEVFE